MLAPQRLERIASRLKRLSQPIGQVMRSNAFVVQMMARQFGLHAATLRPCCRHLLQDFLRD